MKSDPSNAWDSHCREQDTAINNQYDEQETKRPGLYSKFSVTHRNGDPLEAGSFCLVPFNKDGTVRDASAVVALRAYAHSCHVSELQSDINDWLENPQKFEWINEPRP